MPENKSIVIVIGINHNKEHFDIREFVDRGDAQYRYNGGVGAAMKPFDRPAFQIFVATVNAEFYP